MASTLATNPANLADDSGQRSEHFFRQSSACLVVYVFTYITSDTVGGHGNCFIAKYTVICVVRLATVAVCNKFHVLTNVCTFTRGNILLLVAGCITGCSTTCALICLLHHVTAMLERCSYVRCLLIDFSKAFDVVIILYCLLNLLIWVSRTVPLTG